MLCRVQRDQLETDLSLATKKAQRATSELDAVQKMNEEQAARFFEDKNKIQLKSLQHVSLLLPLLPPLSHATHM